MLKKAYRVRNWKEYNKGLINRGSLTFCFSDDMKKNWQKSENRTAHGNQKYSDAIILCSLTFKQ